MCSPRRCPHLLRILPSKGAVICRLPSKGAAVYQRNCGRGNIRLFKLNTLSRIADISAPNSHSPRMLCLSPVSLKEAWCGRMGMWGPSKLCLLTRPRVVVHGVVLHPHRWVSPSMCSRRGRGVNSVLLLLELTTCTPPPCSCPNFGPPSSVFPEGNPLSSPPSWMGEALIALS